ncbi:MAG: hypothetical protein PHU80_04940 [Kiritimatiellae bacterium]|nr:hypothetical protein [Kiritimatiellia bacterium]
MQIKKWIGQIWCGFDKLLMASVIILLVAVWLSSKKAEYGSKTDGGLNLGKTEKREPNKRAPAKVIEGIRISTGADRRARVSEIARLIASSDWASVPKSLAMDMREQVDGKEYEIRLALPENVDEDSVRVTASGHTLTLRMRDSAKGVTYMRNVRVPCRMARDNGVNSVVSNGLLHVRICAE